MRTPSAGKAPAPAAAGEQSGRYIGQAFSLADEILRDAIAEHAGLCSEQPRVDVTPVGVRQAGRAELYIECFQKLHPVFQRHGYRR